jgi:integral membrane protein (TIGR01906 family)
MDHKKPLIILTGILAFTIILLSSVFHYAYSIEHYESELSKTTMRIPLDGAVDASRNVIGFFRDDAQLDKDFFNTQEINHLDDVKTLLTYANIIYMISIMLFWAVIIGTYLLYRKGFSQFVAGVFFTSGIISVATILLLGLATIINFDAMFLLFHMLFFAGNYAFDPAVSNMKAIYTDAFFMSTSVKIAIMTIGKGALMLIAGIFLRKKIGR